MILTILFVFCRSCSIQSRWSRFWGEERGQDSAADTGEDLHGGHSRGRGASFHRERGRRVREHWGVVMKRRKREGGWGRGGGGRRVWTQCSAAACTCDSTVSIVQCSAVQYDTIQCRTCVTMLDSTTAAGMLWEWLWELCALCGV